MSDKNSPKRLERVATAIEDPVAQETILVAAKEIKRQRSRLKEGHVLRDGLSTEITSLKERNRVLEAQIDRLWELSTS